MEKARNENDWNLHLPIKITATLHDLRFLQGLLENLSSRKQDRGFSSRDMPSDWKAIETSAVEAYISGDLKLSDETGYIKMPYITGFIFTCIKPGDGAYGLAWGSSLS